MGLGNFLKETTIARNFNSWFGSNTTHIKNESEHDILAIIASKNQSVSNVSICNGSIQVNFEQGSSWMKGLIKPGNTFPFKRTNSIDYLTIILKKSENHVETTAEDVQICANVSYKVDQSGTPWPQSY